ncbi:DUF4339 domain-containing protein [Luteolibacter soli]|uniref:DUF4339 domain-containing protein n=1 Tax=Luteolibacter soli TaxID=3135280 RepID=A0ABU9B4Z0_9BACT
MNSSPDEANWHYSDGNSSYGPVSIGTLRELAKVGALGSAHLVKRTNDAAWSPFDSRILGVSSLNPDPRSALPNDPVKGGNSDWVLGVIGIVAIIGGGFLLFTNFHPVFIGVLAVGFLLKHLARKG